MFELEVSSKTPAVVLDTNVMLDVFSCHDVFDAYQRVGEGRLNEPELVERRARARESLFLAIYFHQNCVATYGLFDEARAILLERVPPTAHTEFTNHFTVVVLHHVRPTLLSGWVPLGASNASVPLRGNAADQELVDYARRNGLPLVTSEGARRDGSVDTKNKMRKLASQAGVSVYTPGAFWAGKLDAAKATADFLRGIEEHGPRIVAESAKPTVMAETMSYVQGYFEHILLGATRGEPLPARVER